MSDTKAEQILQHITGLVEGISGLTTYRSRTAALSRRQAPALVVAPGTNTPTAEPVSTCRIEWRLEVLLMFYCRGEEPDSQASPFVAAAHAAVMGDRTMGGLALETWPAEQEPQFDKADNSALWLVCPYVVRYRTNVADLTS